MITLALFYIAREMHLKPEELYMGTVIIDLAWCVTLYKIVKLLVGL